MIPAKAKIPVIVIDSQVYRSDLVAMTIVSDNYKAGVLCAKEMMKQKDQANIVLLTHNAARSAVDRINGFLDTIKNNKNYKILASADTQGQIERALPVIIPSLISFFPSGEPSIPYTRTPSLAPLLSRAAKAPIAAGSFNPMTTSMFWYSSIILSTLGSARSICP